MALHKVSQRQLPLLLFGAGLPQLARLAGEAKSYAERLFDYPEIDRLDPTSARAALVQPAKRESVVYKEDALSIILNETDGYPYFLQVWGFHAWEVAPSSPITSFRLYGPGQAWLRSRRKVTVCELLVNWAPSVRLTHCIRETRMCPNSVTVWFWATCGKPAVHFGSRTSRVRISPPRLCKAFRSRMFGLGKAVDGAGCRAWGTCVRKRYNEAGPPIRREDGRIAHANWPNLD